jgi:hypothetical protein
MKESFTASGALNGSFMTSGARYRQVAVGSAQDEKRSKARILLVASSAATLYASDSVG